MYSNLKKREVIQEMLFSKENETRIVKAGSAWIWTRIALDVLTMGGWIVAGVLAWNLLQEVRIFLEM